MCITKIKTEREEKMVTNKHTGNTTLRQALEEMQYNGMNEITRIMPTNELNVWWFEYNTRRKNGRDY